MKLLTGKQMHDVDVKTIESVIPSLELMENAGFALFEAIMQRLEEKEKIIIVCGGGNNGGDGYVLARHLYAADKEVFVYPLETQKLTVETQLNREACVIAGVPFIDNFEGATLLIDCIFGTGLDREVTGMYKDMIEQMNETGIDIVSVDIPSGVDSATGHVLGVAIEAKATYTLQAGKVGLYIYPGRICAGDVHVLDIGIPQVYIDEVESHIFLIEKKNMAALLPERLMHSNKADYGKVLCVGGSVQMSGAITMASLSALRSGAGMMTCAVPQSIRDVIATNVFESMIISLPDDAGLISQGAIEVLRGQLDRYSVILAGCGIGRNDAVVKMVRMLLDSDQPLVLDADALWAFAQVQADYTNRDHLILTPHPKEFADIMGISVKEVIDDFLYWGNQFMEKYPKATLVLKSETTLIFHGQNVYVNTYGNNGLAKGGSGDVLAGCITGLYAQNKQAEQAAILGVFLHAYAGDRVKRRKSVFSLLPTDVLKEIQQVLRKLEEQR
ncbi:hypothetical protein A4S06_00790 [Erysipelotrichaceae bacterium MTC7]|nr:hypothetical protein A4S06_00790 [Erysipelotrichaceae bacterium MTC7]